MAQILDGKKVAREVLEKVKIFISEKKIVPSLAIVLCGNDPASVLYTSMKQKKAAEIGIKAELIALPEEISEEDFVKEIKRLNNSFDGVMVQLPLPKPMNAEVIVNAIDPNKDVDGLTVVNLGKTISGDESLASATPKGIIVLLEYYNIAFKGKKAVIINHSNLIGKPLAAMFLNRGATVTVCHEFTRNLIEHTLNADIVVSAIGAADFVKKEMVKDGAVVIDVGISKKGDKIAGDVHSEVAEKSSFIAPVPGGVGPMTIAMLFQNLLAVKINIYNSSLKEEGK